MAELAGFEILIEQDGGRVDWGDNGLIAYSGIQNLSGTGTLSSEIWTMDDHGYTRRCLTAEVMAIPHLSNDQPDWRSQGDYILFQSANPDLPLTGIPPEQYQRYVQGGFGYNNDLWLMSSDARSFWKLTNVTAGSAILHPHFSPDGSKVFWSASEPMRSGGGGWVLRFADFVLTRKGLPEIRNVQTIAPFGSGAQQVYESHAVTFDNRNVLYSYSPGQPLDLDICMTNVRSGKSVNLTLDPGVWDEHAHWSPDGQTIAWISSHGLPFTPSADWQKTLRTEVWLMNADGSNKRQLTHFNDGSYVICADLSWSPDGKHLALCRTEVTARYGSRQQVLRLDLA
jgi:Tol biopolymer transport system component